MARTIIVQPGQCVEDIALQEYGSINAVPWVVFDNESVFTNGFSTDLQPGTELALRDEVYDRPAYNAIQKLSIVPATNVTTSGPELGDSGDYSEADYNNDHFITP